MEKRVKKSKPELELEVAQQGDKRFLEEYKELVEPLNEKHGRRLVPIINYTQHGALPVYAIERIEVIKPQPANEKREEPEANR